VIGGLVLAAGGSSRFGSPKQLAELDGRPLLQHAVDAMVRAPVDAVIVVLGAEHESVASNIALGRARACVCPEWHRGQAASVRCGLSALPACDQVVVTLGDELGVDASLIAAVLSAAQAGGSARATYDGRPGHPVVLGPEMLARAGEIEGDQGFRDLLGDAPTFEAGHLAAPHDIDTPQDLEKITP
jgi:CTP:molybdopterin cytidylyltransferase MocA